jgi:hypothetical protein
MEDMAMKRMLMAGAAMVLLAGGTARAELVASANDNKATLVNGATVVARNPAPDSVTVLDLSASPARRVAEVQAPASVVGPPFSVALTPDERLVAVTVMN